MAVKPDGGRPVTPASGSGLADLAVEGVPRPLPRPDGPASEFYGWTAQGELRFQRCGDCRRWRHLPRPLCPYCQSPNWAWEPSSGRGEVYTWTTTYRSLHPAFTQVPYAQVIVELEEGVRMLSWVPDVDPDDLRVGMPVTVDFLTVDGVALPVFLAGAG